MPEREETAGTTALRGCVGSGAARVPPEIDDGDVGLRRLGWSEPRRRRRWNGGGVGLREEARGRR